MNRFRNLPIQQKMLVLSLFICGLVLMVVIAAIFVFQVLHFRSTYRRDNSTLATIIANNSAGPMAFNYQDTGAEVLKALAANPGVKSATLVMPDGSVFASYGKPENKDSLAHFPSPGTSAFLGEDLLVTQPVIQKNEQLGRLYVRTDYKRTFAALLDFYLQIIAGVLVVSIILTVLLSKRLGRAITRPVLQLAKTARIIGEKKDYSVRAPKGHSDELGLLAESFNDMLSRIQSQDAALSLSQQKMEALIHSIDGIVWERRPDTFQFNFISRQSQEILGYPPEAWLEQPDFWEKHLHADDVAKAVHAARGAATDGQHYSIEYRMLATKGRTVWIRESGTVLMERGQPVAMRGIFLDITQAKLDAEQLDKLNRQLVDTSRHAGMADVATGVLHNVGNILNSVSVSATLLSERLRRSKLTNLQRAASMLREQNGQLVEFLTNHPKGKLIPDYINTVTEQLIVEQTELISEATLVGEHIEHIKEIVAMQQNYAKIAGVYQDLSPAELVEDALRLNIAALERHRVEVAREFDSNTPAVCVDRHKVMQILINLLRNGKHALEDMEGRRRMVLRINPAGNDRIRITVTDNGIGIPPGNLAKIFNHGFTTKKDGHGFGLHSGANAAKEMGGCLTAHSEGPGKGATFTLELPTAEVRKAEVEALAATS